MNKIIINQRCNNVTKSLSGINAEYIFRDQSTLWLRRFFDLAAVSSGFGLAGGVGVDLPDALESPSVAASSAEIEEVEVEAAAAVEAAVAGVEAESCCCCCFWAREVRPRRREEEDPMAGEEADSEALLEARAAY